MIEMPHTYILYADDDVEDQALLKEHLSAVADITLVCVNNGLRLLQFLDKLDPGMYYPCLIVLDGNMPIMDGLQTLKLLKKEPKYADIPVVMFSTSDDVVEMQQARDLGAVDFFTKPLTSKQLGDIAIRFTNYCKKLSS